MGQMMSLSIMKNPGEDKWDAAAGDYNLDFVIEGKDFDAIQRVIDVSFPPTERLENEGYDDYEKRLKERYLSAASEKGYPLLGRIWDWYDDAVYLSSDVARLRDECLKAQSESRAPEIVGAMNKLMTACERALALNSGIFVGAD